MRLGILMVVLILVGACSAAEEQGTADTATAPQTQPFQPGTGTVPTTSTLGPTPTTTATPPTGAACPTCRVGCTPSQCKICTTGKACGDTCIAQTDTCHVGEGCACNQSG